MRQVEEIVKFEENEDGLFLSTKNTISAVGVDKVDGTVFIDDGYFHSFIDPIDFRSFNIKVDEGKTNIVLKYLDRCLVLGYSKSSVAATGWVEKCNRLIYEIRNKFVHHDIIRFALHSYNKTFPLDKMSLVYQAIVDFIKACIFGESKLKYITQCRATLPQPGSYEIGVQLPIDNNNKNPRKVSSRMIKSLSIISQIQNIDSTYSIIEDQDSPLNIKTCDAILKMMDDGNIVFNVEMDWYEDSSLDKELKNIGGVKIQSKAIPYLKKIRSELIKKDPCYTQITGIITYLSSNDGVSKLEHLKNREIKEKREIKIRGTDTSNKPHSVVVNLSEENYIESCNAMRDKKEVLVTGIMRYEKKKKIIDHAETFQVISK